MKKPILVLKLSKQFLKALRLEASTICLSSLFHLLTTLFVITNFDVSSFGLCLVLGFDVQAGPQLNNALLHYYLNNVAMTLSAA